MINNDFKRKRKKQKLSSSNVELSTSSTSSSSSSSLTTTTTTPSSSLSSFSSPMLMPSSSKSVIRMIEKSDELNIDSKEDSSYSNFTSLTIEQFGQVSLKHNMEQITGATRIREMIKMKSHKHDGAPSYVAVFWDLQNVHFFDQEDINIAIAVEKLQQFVKQFGNHIVKFNAYANINQHKSLCSDPTYRSLLQQSGVTIINVPESANRKEVSDKVLLTDMCLLTTEIYDSFLSHIYDSKSPILSLRNDPGEFQRKQSEKNKNSIQDNRNEYQHFVFDDVYKYCTVVLISCDGDYSLALHRFKQRGAKIMLIGNRTEKLRIPLLTSAHYVCAIEDILET